MEQSNRAKLASAEPRLYTSPHPGGGAAEGEKMRERLDAIDWKILTELQRDGRITNVELSRRVGISAPPCLRRMRALELLAYVGLEHRAGHRATQLSGGEMQRVAIARALANRPALLLADEPTGELDAATGEEILTLFKRLNADGTTLAVVTHDERLAAQAGRVIHMLDGRICD